MEDGDTDNHLHPHRHRHHAGRNQLHGILEKEKIQLNEIKENCLTI